MKSISLSKLIFRQYARSALFVILTVELVLLGMYFGVSFFFERQVKSALEKQLLKEGASAARATAGVIGGNFDLIKRKTTEFAKAHEELFVNPEAFAVPGEQPVFAQDPDGKGTWYQTNLTNGSSLFVSCTGAWGAREKLIATKSAALNDLYRDTVYKTPYVGAAYLNTEGNMNRLYPYIPEVWKVYPSDLTMMDYVFYRPAVENNPDRETRWTDIYKDPAGNGFMFSCIAPVYAAGKLEGVVGLDVPMDGARDELGKMYRPWDGLAVLVSDDGSIIAGDKTMLEKLGLKSLVDSGRQDPNWIPVDKDQHEKTKLPDEVNVNSIKDPELRDELRKLLGGSGPQDELKKISVFGDVYRFLQVPIPGSNWHVLFMVQEKTLFAGIDQIVDAANRSGVYALSAIALFYAGFFLFLRRRAQRIADQIAAPLATLTQATAEFGTNDARAKFASSGIEEVDRLSENLIEMSTSLAEKTKQLVEAQVSSEMKGKEAELSYTRGLYQSAAANLHDAGNAVTVLESSLIDLNKVVRSTDQYPEVFKRLKQGGPAGQDVLGRFEHVLVGETVPRLRGLASSIVRLKDTIKRSIHEQQAIFRSIKRQGEFKREFTQVSESIDLSAMLDEMCGIFRRDYPALEADIPRGLTVRSHKTHLWTGLDNVIRNAIQASPGSGTIRVTAAATGGGAVVRVTDEGAGIAPENLAKVGERGYTTKPEGHGLGLNGFREFLEFFGGGLKVRSAGVGRGATVTVEIHHA